MDLDEEQAEALFPDDRGSDTSDLELGKHLRIERQQSGVLIEIDGEVFDLDEGDVEDMKDECGFESIWWAISERLKTVEYLRGSNGGDKPK